VGYPTAAEALTRLGEIEAPDTAKLESGGPSEDPDLDPATLRRLAYPALMEQVFDEFLAPRRQSTARALQRAVERGETRPGIDTDWICDLLTGPLLMRALLPTGPIDANLARLTVETALEASTV
jgi:hypothetical protein